MTEAELRIERAHLISDQWAIAGQLNSIRPVPVPPGFSPYQQAKIDGLHARANGNVEAIRAIDEQLAAMEKQTAVN